ncbi:MAG: FAD-dependent oxidoreductase [Actinobacteria bacterium]|nr:FAD-dependent oxidoreductase [Actinomycetota bacterium]
MRHFDLCVIGSAVLGEHFAGWDVAVVDGHQRPGDVVPLLAQVADVAEQARHASALGIDTGPVRVRWSDLRDRVAAAVPSATGPGIVAFDGPGRFLAPRTLRVDGEEISADRFVIATGCRPHLPDVPGADDPDLAGRIHDGDSILALEALPASLIIVGGGAAAAEYAHIFAALGTQVTLLHRGGRLLRREDDDISHRFTDLLSRRVVLRLGQHLASVAEAGGRVEVGTTDDDGIEYFFEADHLLLATGRVPDVAGLDLPRAGVETDDEGRIRVDDHQRTTADGVWALCDPRGRTPAAALHALRRQLLDPAGAASGAGRPGVRAVFSGPQVAALGLTERACREQGLAHRVGVAERSGATAPGGGPDLYAKVILDADGGLLGAHLLGPDATKLLQPLVTADDVAALSRDQVHPSFGVVVDALDAALR